MPTALASFTPRQCLGHTPAKAVKLRSSSRRNARTGTYHFRSRPAHEGATVKPRHCEKVKTKMMHKIARSNIQAWLLSVAILISAVHYNVAQAQNNPKQITTAVAIACGKEIKKAVQRQPGRRRPIGADRTAAPVANSVLACFLKSQSKLSARCAALAINVVRMCDSDAARLCQASSRVLKAILSDA